MARSINAPEFYSFTELLELVQRGEIAMPEFQRDFIWTPRMVSELLVTVAKKWPCGTMLLLDGGGDEIAEFEMRPVTNGPDLSEKVEIVVLDGQQRLTAVYHAFNDQAKGEIHYVKLLDVKAAGVLDEEHIVYDRKARFTKTYPTTASQADAGLIKVSDLVRDESFMTWISHLAESDRAGMFELRSELLPGFRDYPMPAITLPKDTQLEALAKIFETINRTGQALKTFDLMVAKLFPKGFKLKDRVAEAAAQPESRLDRFGIEGIEILKLIALWERLRKRDPDEAPSRVRGIRESDVLGLPAEYIIDKFDDAVAAFELALEFVSDRCGALAGFLVPSQTMLIPLADAINSGLDHGKIEKWYWATTFAQRYAQGANTQAVSDARALRAWAASAEAVPADLVQPRLSTESLMDARRRNEILLRGLLSLEVLSDARDWILDERFVDIEESLDVHHVFAKEFLAAHGEGKPDQILNLTLLAPILHSAD